MENQIQVINAPATILDKSRENLVNGAKKTGELIGAYAGTMCEVFNLVDSSGTVITPWYDLTGKAKAGVNIEYAKFIAAFEVKGFTKETIRVYWQRVKEASGKTKAGNIVSGSTSTDQKTQDDLRTLINRIFKAEENGEECKASEFKGELIAVFEALGGNVDKLG